MLYPTAWQDYVLLDSGGGRKLEQFGQYRLCRPEPRAVWKKALPEGEWDAAAAEFHAEERGMGGKWEFREKIEKSWQIAYKEMQIRLEIADSRQVGVFPENAVQWEWVQERLSICRKTPQVLNLFGYTGLASLAAAVCGAKVTHVDSARRAIRLGQESQRLSGMEGAPIRWLVEDAMKFVQREVRRGNKYEGVIMDPPKYGLGPKRERWEFFKHFPSLCKEVQQILSEKACFVVVTAYALESPPDVLERDFAGLVKGRVGEMELGELGLLEKSAGRQLSTSIFARWWR